MSKQIIKTSEAPAPIGPYNQAVMTGDVLYISGQIALDVESGDMVKGDIQQETKAVMENLNAILRAAGLDFQDVVKSSIFIKDMNDFQAINAVYASVFDEESAPARETVEVSRLPKDANVEISMIAVKC